MIYLLQEIIPYIGNTIIKAYHSEAKANKEADRLREIKKYEQDNTQYAVLEVEIE